jgi:DNA-binding NtrC family response regulator
LDIPYLVEHLLNKITKELDKSVKKISKPLMDYLISYDWPGNVRELENVLTRAVLLAKGEVLLKEYVEDSLEKPTSTEDRSFKAFSLREMESKHILQMLQLTNWDRGKTCGILKISRPTLRHKMKVYQITPPE